MFRNDRGTRGGGVFIAVQTNLSAIECVDFITDSEVNTKIALKSKMVLYIGVFYIPERNLTQIHDQPTRNHTLLDLTFTTNQSLIKSTTNAPAISDHAMVVIDADIKPVYIRPS